MSKPKVLDLFLQWCGPGQAFRLGFGYLSSLTHRALAFEWTHFPDPPFPLYPQGLEAKRMELEQMPHRTSDFWEKGGPSPLRFKASRRFQLRWGPPLLGEEADLEACLTAWGQSSHQAPHPHYLLLWCKGPLLSILRHRTSQH